MVQLETLVEPTSCIHSAKPVRTEEIPITNMQQNPTKIQHSMLPGSRTSLGKPSEPSVPVMPPKGAITATTPDTKSRAPYCLLSLAQRTDPTLKCILSNAMVPCRRISSPNTSKPVSHGLPTLQNCKEARKEYVYYCNLVLLCRTASYSGTQQYSGVLRVLSEG